MKFLNIFRNFKKNRKEKIELENKKIKFLELDQKIEQIDKQIFSAMSHQILEVACLGYKEEKTTYEIQSLKDRKARLLKFYGTR